METDTFRTKEKIASIAFSAEEKAAVRAQLIAFMQEHPYTEQSIPSPFYIHITPLHTARVLLAAILIPLLIGGGVAAAAEGTLPGDTLYPVKVHVNEEVRSAIAVSPAAKAGWEAERASRRLKEAETLAVEGRLDATTTATLKTEFEKHAARSVSHASHSADASEQAAVTSDLEATLEAHGTVIDTLIAANDDISKELATVRESVTASAEVSEDARMAAEDEIKGASSTLLATTEARQEAVQTKIAELEVQVGIDDATTTASSTLADEAQAKFEDATETYAEGTSLLKQGSTSDAFLTFQDALRTATEAEVLLNGQKIISSNGGPTTDIATSTDMITATSTLVVPVMPTESTTTIATSSATTSAEEKSFATTTLPLFQITQPFGR